MSKVSDAIVYLENGKEISADTHGNNFAVLCPNCNQFPILFVARKNQKGSYTNNPAICQNCQSSYYIVSDLNKEELSEVLIKKL